MSQPRHTRESIVQTLQNLAGRLGKQARSRRDVQPHIPVSSVNYHFGHLTKALEAAGLGVAGPDPAIYDRMRLSDDELFTSLWEVERRIGHDPTLSEYRANAGQFSPRPFKTRFGPWELTLQHYRKWKAERAGSPVGSSKPPDDSGGANGPVLCAGAPSSAGQPQSQASGTPRRSPPLFGEPIDFRGLRHAPINEQGVVYLSGMVSRELGFSVEALQQGFPDCEAKYQHDKSRKL
jgi:hypothetical protein